MRTYRHCLAAKTPFLAAVLIAAALPGQAATTDGIVSYWPLNEDAGGTTPDAAFGNTLTINGTAVAGPGQKGNAFTFDGASTYLSISHAPDNAATGLPIYRAGSYTVAMWVKGPAQTAKYLFSEGSTTSNNPLLILQTGQAAANNNKFDVIIRTDAGTALVNHVVSTAVVFDDTWHHVAWVDDRGNARLYVDGVLDTANFNYVPGGVFTFDTTAVGTLIRAAVSTGALFNGQIDDLAVWERALTPEEINDVRANGLPSPVPAAAPVLTSAPADTVKRLGDWHRFTVSHTGARPSTYQWFKNGQPIQDATENSYLVTNLVVANTGDTYAVRVTNPGGSVTSTNATLTVLADPAPEVRSGLVNYWPLNEIKQSGADLVSPDLYSGNDMVLAGFPGVDAVSPGQAGNSLSFDSVTQYTYRTNGSPIYNRTNYSVSLWVKAPFEGQNDRRVFSEGSTVNNNPLFTLGTDAAATSPSATVFLRTDANVNAAFVGRRSTRPVFDDTWHHLVWTDANGQGKLYIDGELDETDFNYTRGALTLNVTALGSVVRAAVGNSYFGSIDEVATWSRVLTYTEIQQIMAQGVPAPVAAIPPAITAQPASQTSGVFAGDTVAFTVQASGTEPLTYQWKRNGADIPVAGNPSAGTASLSLANVQVSDTGASFSVSISNAAGSVTSASASLAVVPFTPITGGDVLKLDMGLGGSPNPEPGFGEFTLALNGTNYNGVRLTLSGIGGAVLAERNRTTGAMVTNNPPALTQARIYNDFIFANSATDGTGMRILIERLLPSTPYEVTIWSFDPQSTGGRFADWTETSTGAPVEIQLGYTFDGAILPQNDFEQSFTVTLTSSPAGKLQIDAIRNGGTSVGAFINALHVRLPSNAIRLASAQALNSMIRFTVETPNAGQAFTIQESSALGGAWSAAAGGGVIQVNGNVSTVEFPASGSQKFYRVTSP